MNWRESIHFELMCSALGRELEWEEKRVSIPQIMPQQGFSGKLWVSRVIQLNENKTVRYMIAGKVVCPLLVDDQNPQRNWWILPSGNIKIVFVFD